MKKLQEIRRARDWSLRQTAKKAGISHGDLSQWENYKQPMSEHGAEKLSEALDIPLLRLQTIQWINYYKKFYEQVVQDYDPDQLGPDDEVLERLEEIRPALSDIRPGTSTPDNPATDLGLDEEIEANRWGLYGLAQIATEEAWNFADELPELNKKNLKRGLMEFGQEDAAKHLES